MSQEQKPKGKYIFGFAQVGAKGQIVIPKKAREVFKINSGDNLLILGDEEQGLAIMTKEKYEKLSQQIFDVLKETK